MWLIRIKNTSAIDMAGRIAEIMPVSAVGFPASGASPDRRPRPRPNRSAGPPGDLSTELTITKNRPRREVQQPDRRRPTSARL